MFSQILLVSSKMISWTDSLGTMMIESEGISIMSFFALSLEQLWFLNNRKDLDLQTEEILSRPLSQVREVQRKPVETTIIKRKKTGGNPHSRIYFLAENLLPFSISHLCFPQC